MSTKPTAAPVQAALIVNAPAPVTVSAPDTAALVHQYTTEILPLSKYTINSSSEYIQGNLDWNKAKAFAGAIDDLFAKPVKLAHEAHKALTTLRAQLKAPADQIAAHVGGEIMRYDAEQQRLRRIEEARLQAEENARREAERREAQARADAERAEAEAARQAALAEMALEPWEIDDAVEATLPVVPAPVVVPLQESAPVRLPTSVPQVLGGPRTVDKPWACRVTDPVALLTWILADPEARISLYVDFKMPALNVKARELGKDMAQVIPGTEAVRDQTLKRS